MISIHIYYRLKKNKMHFTGKLNGLYQITELLVKSYLNVLLIDI